MYDFFFGKRNDKILFYDCTNYYFEIEEEDGDKKYGKSKEHRPNPIVQMGMFMDGDGIPLAFLLFPGNANEQTSLKPLEEKVLSEFECQKFVYCSDAGLGSEKIRNYNHMGERAFIVTYSPKFARYQKAIRDAQVDRAQKLIDSGAAKRGRRNPNDPRRFIGKIAVTEDGEKSTVKNYLDTDKIEHEALYDGLYAVFTDLLDDPIEDILKVSEGRWEIEECFRIMKTDFEARPVYLKLETRIKAHFFSCFLSLIIYRYLERAIGFNHTCDEILTTLREMNFVNIKEQGFVPTYKRTKLTDALHDACGFKTDYEFITKSQMRTIQKESKNRKKIP